LAVVHLGIGSNRDRHHNIRAAIKALRSRFNGELHDFRVSRVFCSKAVGFSGSDFFNLVASFTTSLSVEAINYGCKMIELAHGHRSDAPKYSPRTLDIDLLLYDDLVMLAPVQLPRDEITENAFVLWPLAELSPTRVHPITKQTYQQLWQNYNRVQELWPLDFDWEGLVDSEGVVV